MKPTARQLLMIAIYLLALAGIVFLLYSGASYYLTPLIERPRHPDYWSLKPGGTFVYSHGHPMADRDLIRKRCDPDMNYAQCEEYELAWRGFGEPDPVVRSYRRPLESMLNPLIEAGFRIDRILEPKPTEAFRETRPEAYDSLMREPAFLCVRATS